MNQDRGMSITRRRWVAGAGAAAFLGGCARSPRKKAPVSIYRAASYSEDLYKLVARIIAEHGLDVRGKRVVLKPNLVEFDEHAVINTNPKLVHAALEGFRAAGAAEVRIAEGPGHRRVTLDLKLTQRVIFPLCRVSNPCLPILTSMRSHRCVFAIPIPSLIRFSAGHDSQMRSAGFAAKDETHHWVGATLSMKNLFGIVPGAVYGWPKNVLHWAGIDETIADLHNLFPRVFSIVDGIVSMEGNGPIQGTSRQVGVVVSGRSGRRGRDVLSNHAN